jgi:hypothetical protein
VHERGEDARAARQRRRDISPPTRPSRTRTQSSIPLEASLRASRAVWDGPMSVTRWRKVCGRGRAGRRSRWWPRCRRWPSPCSAWTPSRVDLVCPSVIVSNVARY